MDEEACRLDIQLFADVFADLDQILTALTAGTGFRLMKMVDTRQVRGQRLTTGTGTRWARNGGLCLFCLALGQLRFGGRHVAGHRFLEQVTMFGAEGFATGAKAHPAQVSQLQNEGLNLEVTAGDLRVQLNGFGGLHLNLIEQFLNGTRHPLREFGRGVHSG